jgi:hypothetical protein
MPVKTPKTAVKTTEENLNYSGTTRNYELSFKDEIGYDMVYLPP